MSRVCSRGFTLVELLVAMTLVGLVAAGAYETLRTAMRGWDGAERRVEVLAEQRTVERFLRRQLEQVVALAERERQVQHVAFDGEPSRLRLYADFPAHLGAGLHELVFTFEDHDGALRLVVRYRPAVLGDDRGPEIEPETAVLLDGLEHGGFEYFGVVAGDGPPAWSPDWLDADRLPALVRIAWKLEGAPPWPVLTVAPRSDGVRIRTRAEPNRQQSRPPGAAAPTGVSPPAPGVRAVPGSGS